MRRHPHHQADESQLRQRRRVRVVRLSAEITAIVTRRDVCEAGADAFAVYRNARLITLAPHPVYVAGVIIAAG